MFYSVLNDSSLSNFSIKPIFIILALFSTLCFYSPDAPAQKRKIPGKMSPQQQDNQSTQTQKPTQQTQQQNIGNQPSEDNKPRNAQSGTDAQEKTPSLKDTTEWIKEKVVAYAGITTTKAGMSLSFRYDLIRFEECIFMYRSIIKTSLPGIMEATTENDHSLSLSDIDPLKVEVVKLPDGKSFGVVLNTANGNNKIVSKGTTTIHSPPKRDEIKETSDSFNKVTLNFQEEEIANRVAKAFINGVNLCKGRKEPF